jgi:hypothetical protein
MIEAAAPDATMQAKYASLAKVIQATLHAFGIASETAPVAEAYCPGRFDIAVEGKKIAGISQHWFRNPRGTRCAVTAASINVEESPEVLAAVVNRFYCSAESPGHCDATVITNIRCNARSLVAEQDLVVAIADSLGRLAVRSLTSGAK